MKWAQDSMSLTIYWSHKASTDSFKENIIWNLFNPNNYQKMESFIASWKTLKILMN
jgi:hypothetical protein